MSHALDPHSANGKDEKFLYDSPKVTQGLQLWFPDDSPRVTQGLQLWFPL